MSSQIVSSQTMPSETEARSNRSDDALALEEDARLRTDIRLLGRILGDTVRDQEGADVFDLVERIRQTSIRFHRDEDKLARRELETILDSMSTSDTVRIVRAFSYFSHLAKLPRIKTTSARCAGVAPAARGRARFRKPCRMRRPPVSAPPTFANSLGRPRSVRS
jgi:phosphoenolpyruvate carboxylase